MRKVYLGTVAFLPIAMLVLLVYSFWPRLEPAPLPIDLVVSVLRWNCLYCAIGTIIILVDLWRSKRNRDFKMLWTVLIVCFAFVTVPIYWFLFIRQDRLRSQSDD